MHVTCSRPLVDYSGSLPILCLQKKDERHGCSGIDTPRHHAEYFSGADCTLAASTAKGCHLLASRDFACGEPIIVSEAYLTALCPSYRKRICAACLRDGGRQLSVHCAACGQAWYSSEACRAAHSRADEPPGLTRLLHGHCNIAITPDCCKDAFTPPGRCPHVIMAPFQAAVFPTLVVLATGAPTGDHNVPRIPHGMLCPVLKQFSGLNWWGLIALPIGTIAVCTTMS